MAKRKSPFRAVTRTKERGQTPDLRRQGLRAFNSGNYSQAISAWSELAQPDPRVVKALAEAYVRRSRTHSTEAGRVADLQKALELAPDELRYEYQLGLALHRAGELSGAIERYRSVLARDPVWPGVATALALALLEADPQTDLAAMPEIPPDIRAELAPVQALLRGESPEETGETPARRLWRGLALLRAGDSTAYLTLDDRRPLHSARASAIRRYYIGVAAAQAGNLDDALDAWERTYTEETRRGASDVRPWLRDNLVIALTSRLTAQLTAGDLDGALGSARRAMKLSLSGTALNSQLVDTLDRAARAAVASGDWTRAATLWEEARKVVSSSAGLGSPRPLLHNLALAYEAQERWTEAAETWRAMLRTRPRTATEVGGAVPTAEQWAWVRKRVIECYKRAGEPGEAVSVYRQAIKADPDDLELRLDLADALAANDQDQAAMNELHRVLERDPDHIQANLKLAAIHNARGEWWMAESRLRNALERAPEREDVRRQLAALLLQRGERMHRLGHTSQASRAFEEGQRLAPEDYKFSLNLARLAIEGRKWKRAREMLERVIELAGDEPEIYIYAIECWMVADKLDEAKVMLARAEDALSPTPEFYIEVAALLLGHKATPDIRNSFRRKPPAGATDDDWSRFAKELLDRVVSLGNNDPQIHLQIAGELMPVDARLALQYAETAVKLLPGDIQALMVLGLTQGMNGDKRTAKKTMNRAARLAREEGDMETLRRVEETRRELDSPFFDLAIRMGPALGDIVDQGLDIEDFLDIEDLFK